VRMRIAALYHGLVRHNTGNRLALFRLPRRINAVRAQINYIEQPRAEMRRRQIVVLVVNCQVVEALSRRPRQVKYG